MPAQALDSPRLSKSTYLKGKQCHLHLWRHFHARDLAAPADEALKLVFKTGHEVGELACRRYPGGHLIAHDHEHQREALRETRQVIDAGAAPALFEAAFEHEHVFVRADVLERLPDGGWRLVEVKSTTRLKPAFIPDVAVQLWVLRGAGLDVREAGVLTLNRDYVYDGVRLDVNALFKLHPVLDEATALLEGIGGEAQEMRPLLTQSEAPAVAPGEHCVSPYLCPYYAHCNQGVAGPEHGIGELPRLSKRRLLHRPQTDCRGGGPELQHAARNDPGFQRRGDGGRSCRLRTTRRWTGSSGDGVLRARRANRSGPSGHCAASAGRSPRPRAADWRLRINAEVEAEA